MKLQRFATALGLAFASSPGFGVYLNADGLGQALLYPYYTVQSNGTDAYNTLLSVTNTTAVAKVVKVRFREGKNSRSVFEFNVYLGRNDMWTAAVVPDGDGARIISRDASCTNPPLPAAGVPFVNFLYTGASNDGVGGGLDRTREGSFEIIEMATLSGAAAAALKQPPDGLTNCAAVQGLSVDLGVLGAPTGGLAGAASLINVNTGLDITYNAEALANLSAAPLYTPPATDGTDFDSPAVDPVAGFTSGNVAYRLVFAKGLDAVRAALMTRFFENEYVLDANTQSKTDWVLSFPLRRFNFSPLSPTPRLSDCYRPTPAIFNRDNGGPSGVNFPEPPPNPYVACWSTMVFPVRFSQSASSTVSDVLASRNLMGEPTFVTPDGLTTLPAFVVPFSSAPYSNGRINLEWNTDTLQSLPSSTATNLLTGAVTIGAFTLTGAPAQGFMARTFVNGNLACGSVVCQGTYSGAFAHRRIRQITGP